MIISHTERGRQAMMVIGTAVFLLAAGWYLQSIGMLPGPNENPNPRPNDIPKTPQPPQPTQPKPDDDWWGNGGFDKWKPSPR